MTRIAEVLRMEDVCIAVLCVVLKGVGAGADGRGGGALEEDIGLLRVYDRFRTVLRGWGAVVEDFMTARAVVTRDHIIMTGRILLTRRCNTTTARLHTTGVEAARGTVCRVGTSTATRTRHCLLALGMAHKSCFSFVV